MQLFVLAVHTLCVHALALFLTSFHCKQIRTQKINDTGKERENNTRTLSQYCRERKMKNVSVAIFLSPPHDSI